jgi:hydrogenase expression/formation protein HypD
MLRVPGSKHDLLSVKAKGGDVRMVYSPLDAVKIANENPNKQVVFFAVGFETTAPANAMSVMQACKKGIKNYSILCSHVLVPPAIEALLSSEDNNINAILAAGHVCTVMGYHEYVPLAKKYRIPIVVTGFEPIDILHGILIAVTQLEEKRHDVENQYMRAVTKDGNVHAQNLMKEVFEIADRKWRGIGFIPRSGLKLKQKYQKFDAEKIFRVDDISAEESDICIAGQILRGLKKPFECMAFGNECTPERPLGAPMVSSEGACAAYFHYRKAE